MIGIIVIVIVIVINVYFLSRIDDMPLSFADKSSKNGTTQSPVKNVHLLSNQANMHVPKRYNHGH